MIIGVNATNRWVQYGQYSIHSSMVKEWDAHGHIETLPNQLQSLMINEMSGALVILGPGSYTGIRLSLTVLKMMALLYNVPLVGFSLFDAYMSVNHLLIRGLTVLASPSRKGMLNVQVYQSQKDAFFPVSSLLQVPLPGFESFLNRFNFAIHCHYFGEQDQLPSLPKVDVQCVRLDLLSLLRVKSSDIELSQVTTARLSPIYSSPPVLIQKS